MEKVPGHPPRPRGRIEKAALSKSDFQKAAQALEKLQKQLADSQLYAAKKENLSKQFQQLKQKIDEMAKQNKDAQADLQKRADQMAKQNMDAQADPQKQPGDADAAKQARRSRSRNSSSSARRWKPCRTWPTSSGSVPSR